VKPGLVESFLAALGEAKPLMLAQPGCRSLQIVRSIETPNRFVLLVEWDSVEDHEQGFRGSAAYGEWRRLLHHHYDPMPVVEHFTTVVDEAPRRYGA
jgi:heme-degrading monooxygenase HmoA